MRLDARVGDTGYEIFHVERMRSITDRVVWVDDELHAWGEYRWPPAPSGGHHLVEARLTRLVVILPQWKLVLVNPVADEQLAAEFMRQRHAARRA